MASTKDLDDIADARAAGLRYSSDDEPGLARQGKPGKFHYIEANGAPITEERTLTRIEGLVIPPAWSEVWICPSPRGHLQVTGRDAKGRKQYRYHPRWHLHRDSEKFAHMAEFGRALPALRKALNKDMARRSLCRERVLAIIVRLLETTLVRIGNDQYAKANKSYGLTTLKNRHLRTKNGRLLLAFKGKSGVEHRTPITDRRARTVIKRLQDLPGQRLFQYEDEDGAPHALTSADVNEYLREVSGADITAKDFRTWAATLGAARDLALINPPLSEAEAKRSIVTCVKNTARQLHNTPAVCRAAYIHPEVFSGWRAGALKGKFTGKHGSDEKALLRFLDSIA